MGDNENTKKPNKDDRRELEKARLADTPDDDPRGKNTETVQAEARNGKDDE